MDAGTESATAVTGMTAGPAAGEGVDRRTALIGAGAVVGLAALTACGSSSTAAKASTTAATAAPTTAAAATTSAAATTAAAAGGPIVALASVPVGGSVSLKAPDGSPVVVAQPTAGKAVAFTAICTHMGCTVKSEGKVLHCPCHGSMYDAFTGKVTHGPAKEDLAAIAVHVQGGQVVSGA